MPRALMLALVVVGSLVGGVAVVALAQRLFSPLSDQALAEVPLTGSAGVVPASANEQPSPLSPRELERTIGQLIDDMGGHPDDPQLPQSVLGASDEVIAAMDPMEVKLLLEDPDVMGFLGRHDDEPRYAFALGRLAMFHGYNSLADQLLRKAVRHGSGAAAAYLADPTLTTDDAEAARLLRQAVELGFEPASAWLAEMQGGDTTVAPVAGSSIPPFRFEDFDRPDIIRAFYEGRAPSGLSELETWGYISSLLRGTSDSSNLFMVQDPRAFYLELSPSLQAHADIAMTTSAQAIGESLDMTLQQFMGMLQGMQQGGSLTGAAAQMNRNMIAPQEALILAKASGEHDGRRLALTYDFHTREFRRIYAGLKKYVESRR